MRLSILFSLALSALSVSATSKKEQCLRNPSVRKEWRDTTDKEKAAFIKALKVCLYYSGGACVLTQSTSALQQSRTRTLPLLELHPTFRLRALQRRSTTTLCISIWTLTTWIILRLVS